MTRGHGGAGLFSDGKFSFFPSATELWSLARGDKLREAFDWTCSVLRSAGLSTPPFPEDPGTCSAGSGEWVLKEYPSDYLSLPARLEMISNLVSAAEVDWIERTEVVEARYEPGADRFELLLQDHKGQRSPASAGRLLVATGRFGPLSLPGLTRHRSFRRMEVGFRIEQPAERAFFRDLPQLDPKLRFREGNVEWRTFCACRQGEAVLTETQRLWTVSGRADCPPTGRSNVGFNTRILDEATAEQLLAPVLASLADEENHFSRSLSEARDPASGASAELDRIYGPVLRGHMMRGLDRLCEAFPEVDSAETVLIGPTLEGVGWYPEVDAELRAKDCPAWLVGDSCGRFRGIVAAMISGYYGASRALAEVPA